MRNYLFFSGSSEKGVYLADDAFFEIINEETQSKIPRLSNGELRKCLAEGKKIKLTKEQRLLKSVSLTLLGLIGYSLPAFYFFHMSSFYVQDKLKPVCQVCNYTLSASFWISVALIDGLMSTPEEMIFGDGVPIDVVGTAGTIPGDLGNINALRELLKERRDFGKKTY
jgi:hypothetical protein